MWITEFKSYKTFLKAYIRSQPKKGFGQGRRLAEYLNVAPITISQVLSGDRHFTQDQAMMVAEFYGFGESTTEYFIYLLNLERVDKKSLKAFYQKKLDAIKRESNKVKAVTKQNTQLNEQNTGIFYSSWYYSGVSLLISIPGFNTVDAIATYFDLPRVKIREIVTFLTSTGLCTEEHGKLKMGPTYTHVGPESPFLDIHRQNWRMRAMEKFPKSSSDDVFFSGPVSISKKDADVMRKEIMALIKSFLDRVAPSPEETLRCLNIDWFGF